MQVDGEAWLVPPGKIVISKLSIQVGGCGFITGTKINKI